MSQPKPSEPGPRPWRRGGAPQERLSQPSWSLSARQRQLYWIIAGLCAVGGAILAWVLVFRAFDEPFFLSVTVTAYDDPGLPPVAWAAQDGSLLLTHFSEARRRNLFNCQQAHELREALRDIQKINAPAIVVHLRAHALARDGGVFLLPGDANLEERHKWVGIDEVLQMLAAARAPKRLMLLSIMQPLNVPLLGPLDDDVATPLDSVLKEELKKWDSSKRADESLFVLCAAGPGQAAHVSEELGASAFAYYLYEGLRGAADGTDEENGLVSAKELAAYVRRRVERWSRVARGAEQTPVLHSSGPDFHLVSTATRRPGPHALRDIVAYPDWLQEGWQMRDSWWKAGSYRTQPLLLRRLELSLLRAEERWRAGVGEDTARDEVRAALTRFGPRRQPPPAEPRPERSLAVAQANGRAADPALVQKLEGLLEQVQSAKPEEADKLRAGFLALFKGRPFDLAMTVAEVARQTPKLRRETMAFMGALLREQPGADDFAEARWLRRLGEACAAMRKIDAARLPDGALRLAVNVIVEVERAALFAPRSLPWLRERHREASTRRYEGLQLFLKEPDAWPEAMRRWTQTIGFCRELNEADVWLVNTGWTGGPHGVGTRMRIAYTRAMITAILNGSLKNAKFTPDPVFGLPIPDAIPGGSVPADVLNPKNTWKDKAAYDAKAKDLAKRFRENDAKFEMDAAVRAAGPRG